LIKGLRYRSESDYPHSISTTFELGWSTLKNGDLLKRAETDGFDALVTTDQNLKYQQVLSGRRLAVVVLLTTSWPRIDRHSGVIAARLESLQQGEYIEIAIP
jgi:hypothetical protein